MKLCLIIPIDGRLLGGMRPVDPGFGVDEGGHPDHELPPVPNPPPGQPGHLPSVPVGWPVRPAHPIALPGWRPVDPGYGHGTGHHPDHSLPPGSPGTPGNELPEVPPPVAPPGMVLVLARAPGGKWYYATISASVIPTPLPTPPPVAQPKS